MIMGKYRKKPVVIEAVQWTGDNHEEISAFCPDAKWDVRKELLSIGTLEGPLVASKQDFIIRGVKGEFYPCKPDIFAKTYEPVV
jgi:hypothetical protein